MSKRIRAQSKGVAHMEKLNKNIEDVRRLVLVFARKAKLDTLDKKTLRKGAMVLFTACWEAFIEDLAVASFEFLMKQCSTHKTIPDTVKRFAVKKIHQSKDGKDMWVLAGVGWRDVLRKHKRETIEEFIGRINNPKDDNIDEMFRALIGLNNLSKNWKWRGTQSGQAKNKLTRYLVLRGQIAHRVASDESITTEMAVDYVNFIFRLAVRSHNTVREYLIKATKKTPWPSYSFGHTN